MFDWLKNKVGMQGQSYTKAASLLEMQLTPLERIAGAGKRIAERLTRFVLTGEGEAVVAELASLQSNQSYYIFSANLGEIADTSVATIASIVEILPQDPNLYLRLAHVYEAATYAARIRINSYIPAFDGDLHWLAVFLLRISDSGNQKEPFFPVNLVQAMIALNNQDPNHLVRGAFLYDDSEGKSRIYRWQKRPYCYFQCLTGFPEVVLSSAEIVREAFRQKDSTSRACALQAVYALKIPAGTFIEEIAALAVSGSKEVRECAEPLSKDRFQEMQPLLERFAASGSSDQRYHAIRLLARIGGVASHSFLQQRLDEEKSSKVAEAIRASFCETESGDDKNHPTEAYDFPEVPDVPVKAPLDRQVLADLRVLITELERKTAEAFAKNQWAQQRNLKRVPYTIDLADQLYDALQRLEVKEKKTGELFDRSFLGPGDQLLNDFAAHPGFELIHLVRWCLLLTVSNKDKLDWRVLLNYTWRAPFLKYQKARKKPIDLRQLAAVFRAVGLNDRIIGEQFLNGSQFFPAPFFCSDPGAIWPYFAERLDLLEEALGLKRVVDEVSSYYSREQEKRQNAFSVLKLFPILPSKFVPILWDLALGPGKTERPIAQECLGRVGNKEERIVTALESRQQDARLAAAEWIARLEFREAIPALRSALLKEKSESVKDELIKTLEGLGVKLEELLDLDKLDTEAEAGLKKGIPRDLEWFPFDQLPSVRWADSGNQVPRTILHWFLVQGFKLRSAEANPTLRRYCSLIKKEDREKLGRFVLETWIAKDTKPGNTAEQAAALAQKETQVLAGYAKQYPNYYPDFEEQRTYQTIFNRLLIQPEGSQNSTKGILAVASACCGGDVAPIVHAYVKQWFGYRAAQCKALLQVLAWIDHSAATQVVLAIANRFRTKGIQEEAMRLCQLIASRKGWTLDELSDRTVPTAGLDEDGKLELDYGARMFSARLSEEMSITLSNQAGKTISSLPDGNKSDDPERVKLSKTMLSASRKELKSVLPMQKARLYEALCTQKQWCFEDWDIYLRKHPIVGRYCQRLVWIVCEGESAGSSFRPLPDGTLSNHQDDEVIYDRASMIRLAHDQTIAAEDRSAWLQHFSDYEVEPLFQQFGKPSFDLTELMKGTSEITEFLGHIVKAFSLRSRLTKLGYTRGGSQDGGWFFDYHKSFIGLGIEAIIEFTGNGLPEENRTVALQRLYFARNILDNPSGAQEITLGELPLVLLTECWNDIRIAAADGPGFASDWEKQTEF